MQEVNGECGCFCLLIVLYEKGFAQVHNLQTPCDYIPIDIRKGDRKMQRKHCYRGVSYLQTQCNQPSNLPEETVQQWRGVKWRSNTKHPQKQSSEKGFPALILFQYRGTAYIKNTSTVDSSKGISGVI